MNTYSLQEQIVMIETFKRLLNRDILPLGIDISDGPNNLDSETIEILNRYYRENDGIMTLNIVNLEDDYAKGIIKFKKYIKVNPDNGDILVLYIRSICSVRSIESYFSVIIQPFFLKSDETEHVFISGKTQELIENYTKRKEQSKKGRVL